MLFEYTRLHICTKFREPSLALKEVTFQQELKTTAKYTPLSEVNQANLAWSV